MELTHPLRCYAVSRELGLDLGKPDFRIGGPEGWQLDADSSDGRGGGVTLTSRSIGRGFFERHHESIVRES